MEPANPLPLQAQAQDAQTALSDTQLQMLLDEAQRLQTLYLDARNGVQSVFNFYLTFITAVIGGVVFIVQNADGALTAQTQLTLIGLLFFAELVGSVYINIYSRLLIQRFSKVLNVRVDMGGILSGWAARQ